jgi:hypothetical protein
MNLFKKPIIGLACALLAMPMSGFAQYQFEVDPFFSYFNDLQRYEIAFTGVLPSAQFQGVTPAYAGNTYIGDTTAKRPTPGIGYGGSIGLSIPFKATGHISCWAMDIHILANMYTWTDLNKTYSIDGSYHSITPSLDGTTLQIGLPIGIEWKAGNDAIKTKRLPFGTSLGVGVMPSYNMTNISKLDSANSHGAFAFNPYVKGEISLFLGIDFKLRVMYTLGDVTLIDVNKAPNYRIDGPFKVTSGNNLMVSLVIMPFSVRWNEHSWYTTHDTYNMHDRFN